MNDLKEFFAKEIEFTNGENFFSSTDKKKITNYLRLLRDESDRAEFKRYLKGSMRRHKSSLTKFFRCVEKRVFTENQRPIQLGYLTKELYGTSKADDWKLKLRSDFKKLREEIIRFRGLQHLVNDEAELHRIQLEAIRNEGHLSVYKESVEKWMDSAEKIPHGSKSAYHKWAAADAGYFALEIKKNDKNDGTFVEAVSGLHDFIVHNYLHYANELFIRSKQVGKDEIPNGGNELLRLQYLLACLHQSEGIQLELFEEFKTYYKDVINLISSEWALAILVLLQNYLIRMKRLGELDFYYRESVLVGYFLLEEPVFKKLKVITKNLFLNQLQNAIDAKEEVLINRIIDELSLKLSPEIRETTLLVANIGLQFIQEDFKGVISEVKKTNHKTWKDKYVDYLRLKSYRLRSAILVNQNDITYTEEVELAFDDFKRYFKENFEKANLPPAKIEEIDKFLRFCRKVITMINGKKLISSKNELTRFCEQNTAFHARDWMISYLELESP